MSEQVMCFLLSVLLLLASPDWSEGGSFDGSLPLATEAIDHILHNLRDTDQHSDHLAGWTQHYPRLSDIDALVKMQ